MAVFLGCTSTSRVGLRFLWFFVQELLEAQPAVVLVLKRLRRWGKWLEVSSDRLGELGILFVAVFLGCTSTGRVGLWFLWFYVGEHLKAQPAVVLILKSHPTDWEKPGIDPATPGLHLKDFDCQCTF